MVEGVAYFNERDTFYTQTNNPTESLLKKVRETADSRGGWLESCGPTSAINCLAAMGKRIDVVCPGDYNPQPEEVLMDYFNDPRNASKLEEVRSLGDGSVTIPYNRVPQYYPLAVWDVFDVRGSFHWSPDFDRIVKKVRAGNAIQVCLKSPGHYIALVAYDLSTDELIFNDSWGDRFKDGKGGWNRRMSRDEFSSNVQPYYIVYHVS